MPGMSLQSSRWLGRACIFNEEVVFKRLALASEKISVGKYFFFFLLGAVVGWGLYRGWISQS